MLNHGACDEFSFGQFLLPKFSKSSVLTVIGPWSNDHGVEMKNHSWSNTVINTADHDLSWSAVFDHDIMVFISTGTDQLAVQMFIIIPRPINFEIVFKGH